MSEKIVGLNEHYCPVCGKEFYPTREWVYRDKVGIVYCSYKCMRVVQKREAQKKERKHKVVLQYTLNEEYISEFKSIDHAANWVLGTYQGISRACVNSTPYKGYLWRYKDEVSEV